MKKWTASAFIAMFIIVNIPAGVFAIGSGAEIESNTAQTVNQELNSQPIPMAELDLTIPALKNLPNGAKYSVDDGMTWIIGQSKTEERLDFIMDQLVAGRTIAVYMPGDGEQTMDSDYQIIEIGEQAVPTGVDVINPATANETGSIIGLNDSMEVTYNEGTQWERVTSERIDGLTPGSYWIRAGMSKTKMPSDALEVRIEEFVQPAPVRQEETPSAIFDAESMTIMNLPSNGAYSLDAGNTWTKVNTKLLSGIMPSVKLPSINSDTDVLVKTFGNGTDTIDSEIQIIRIGQQPQPAGIVGVPAAKADGTGSLEYVTNAMEYRKEGNEAWIEITENIVSNLEPGVYEIRNRAKDANLPSEVLRVTIPVTEQKKKASTPNGTFDAVSKSVKNVGYGMNYSVDGGHDWYGIADIKANTVKLSDQQAVSAIAHGGIFLKTVGNGKNTIDSDIQIIAIAKANVPRGIVVTNSGDDNKSGTIAGLDTSMEYCKKGENWVSVHGEKITGLSKGTYYIRVKAYGSTLCSDSMTIEIEQNQVKSKEAVPTADFNAMIMTLSNIRGVKFSLDGGNTWQFYTDRDSVLLKENEVSPAKGILLFRPGSGHSLDSDRQTIMIKKADAPANITVADATESSLGVIGNVNQYMEYRASISNSWTGINGNALAGLNPGTYYVRVHGRYNVLASEAVTVLIKKTSNAQDVSTPSEEVSSQEIEESYNNLEVKEPDITLMSQEEYHVAEGVPWLKDNSQIAGWDAICEEIEVTNADFLAIEMNGTAIVPQNILKAAKETGIDLDITMGENLHWLIFASTIEEVREDINLQIIASDSAVPSELLHSLSGLGMVNNEFTVIHNGEFGFRSILTMQINENDIGQYANLLYYNPKSQKLEFIDAGTIDDIGYAAFHMSHASSYVVVVGPQSLEDKLSSYTGESTGIWGKILFILLFVVITVAAIIITIKIDRKLIRKHRRK